MIEVNGVNYSVYGYRLFCADMLAWTLANRTSESLMRVEFWLNAWQEMDRLSGEATK